MSSATQLGSTPAPESPAVECHYTAAEVAEMWQLSADTVRRLFEREPGVLVIGDTRPRHKRRHVTLRIPASVIERVHHRLSVVECPAIRGPRC